MGLTVYALEDMNQWNQRVRSFAQYNVYYLGGYAKAFQLHGDGEPLMFYYEDEGLRGLNVVMKRDIAKDPRLTDQLPEGETFDLATPYGYGGWLLEGEGDIAPLFAAYEDWCRNNGIVSEFVRFQPVLENQKRLETVYDIVPLGHTVTIDLKDSEGIWNHFSSDNRKAVRKAQKAGITINRSDTQEAYEKFRKIYQANMDYVEAAQYYYFSEDFFQCMKQELSQSAQVFSAELENGEVVAATIMFSANGSMDCFLSASYREYQKIAPTNLMWYEAAVWGSHNGCKTLHVGGGVGSGEDSLYKFKKSFYKGEPTQYYIGKKILDPVRYDQLVALRTDLPESGFFPRYRA